MKETKIAEQNIKVFDKEKGETDIDYDTNLTHKQTCQRWLEFLEEIDNNYAVGIVEGKAFKDSAEIVIEKITDLKQAIKLYNEAGI